MCRVCLVSIKVKKEAIGSPDTRVTDGSGFWEQNLDPLEKKSVFLTTERSLQPLQPIILFHFLILLL